MKEARDGFPTHFLKNQLRYTLKQVHCAIILDDPKMKALVEEKLNQILLVRPLLRGYVHYDVQFFKVPKGENDIKIVYNGTKNGINLIV